MAITLLAISGGYINMMVMFGLLVSVMIVSASDSRVPSVNEGPPKII